MFNRLGSLKERLSSHTDEATADATSVLRVQPWPHSGRVASHLPSPYAAAPGALAWDADDVVGPPVLAMPSALHAESSGHELSGNGSMGKGLTKVPSKLMSMLSGSLSLRRSKGNRVVCSEDGRGPVCSNQDDTQHLEHSDQQLNKENNAVTAFHHNVAPPLPRAASAKRQAAVPVVQVSALPPAPLPPARLPARQPALLAPRPPEPHLLRTPSLPAPHESAPQRLDPGQALDECCDDVAASAAQRPSPSGRLVRSTSARGPSTTSLYYPVERPGSRASGSGVGGSGETWGSSAASILPGWCAGGAIASVGTLGAGLPVPPRQPRTSAPGGRMSSGGSAGAASGSCSILERSGPQAQASIAPLPPAPGRTVQNDVRYTRIASASASLGGGGGESGESWGSAALSGGALDRSGEMGAAGEGGPLPLVPRPLLRRTLSGRSALPAVA